MVGPVDKLNLEYGMSFYKFFAALVIVAASLFAPVAALAFDSAAFSDGLKKWAEALDQDLSHGEIVSDGSGNVSVKDVMITLDKRDGQVSIGIWDFSGCRPRSWGV